MIKRYDAIYAAVLILFLAAAYLIGISILKGILLFLFSAVLVYNTLLKLIANKTDQLKQKILYGILLFLESLLATGALTVIAAALV